MTKAKMKAAAFQFKQDADCCSDVSPQILTLEVLNGADFGDENDFYIIETDRWAFDSIEEIVELLKKAGCRDSVDHSEQDRQDERNAFETGKQGPTV